MLKNKPVSYDDFRKLRENNCYYVDKTLFIQEFLDIAVEVTLITRPRRFGKTLNMTMLRDFFDVMQDSNQIFEGTNIMKTEYASLINSMPVISLSFKGCEADNEYDLLNNIREVIYNEYKRYQGIIDNSDIISKQTKKDYYNIYNILEDINDNKNLSVAIQWSILRLSTILEEQFGKKTYILLDEYDQPFLCAYNKGYYDKVSSTLGNMLCNTFKGNNSMHRGVLTGIQRIAKESVFSRFNNPLVCTVADRQFCDKFGLLEEEAREYLEYYGYSLNDSIREYYDGYRFFDKFVYNPMSITSYIYNDGTLQPYWVNTSTNQLIKDEIMSNDSRFIEEFKELIEREIIEVRANLQTAFVELKSNDTLWGLLVNAGYVTIQEVTDYMSGYYMIKIPNAEVKEEFKRIVEHYVNIEGKLLRDMFVALQKNDIDNFKKIYKKIVIECTSYYDMSRNTEGKIKENPYHMLMLGMCVYLQGRYDIKSNIENGLGRADIIIKAKNKNDMSIIIEFKSTKAKNIKNVASNALKQIHTKKYYTGMDGNILLLGIAHKVKEVEMVSELISNN